MDFEVQLYVVRRTYNLEEPPAVCSVRVTRNGFFLSNFGFQLSGSMTHHKTTTTPLSQGVLFYKRLLYLVKRIQPTNGPIASAKQPSQVTNHAGCVVEGCGTCTRLCR
jgi:hypothetical protein